MNAAALGLDDVRRQRETLRAVVTSIVLHLLLILGIALFLSLDRPIENLPPEEETVEFTFVDPPPAPADTTPSFLSTTDAQRSETAPENAPFESDKNTRAASELPAEGNVPLPTQRGEDIPGTEFENREYSAGKEPRPASPPQAPPAEAAPPAEKAPPTETVQPRVTPPASEIALLQPVRPREKPQPTPEQKPTTQPARIPKPQPPSATGFQPQTRVTRLKGNISNRGRAAADAAATPLGRYKKQLSDAIGSRWYYYVNEAISLLNIGTVELRFIVRKDGKVEKVQVLRNSSNESFASTSVRAVMEAEIPPIPEEILPMLQNGSIEVDYSFSILGN